MLVVFVAAVAILALIFTGVLPLFGTNGPTGLTFADAGRAALASAGQSLGGTWQVLGGVGLDDRVSSVLTVGNLSSTMYPNCTPTPLSGAPLSGELVVPTFAGTFSSGLAPFWLVQLEGSVSGPFVLVAVEEQNTLPLLEASGTGCLTPGTLPQPIPNGTVDSPVAAATAWGSAGSSWTRTDPALSSLTMGVYGPGSLRSVAYSGAWTFVYAPCNPLAGGSVNETAFWAQVNLTTGAYLAGLSTSIACPA